jgi:hypothetical protein
MEHGTHSVDLVDENGLVVGNKLRREINKKNDVYHTIYTLLVSPVGRVVLAKIPTRADLPNLYDGRFGASVATIRRTDESPMSAAERSVARELYIDEPELVPVGGGYFQADGRGTYVSVYYLVANIPQTFSSTDIAELAEFSPHDLTEQIKANPDKFAPNLITLWERYSSRLPL